MKQFVKNYTFSPSSKTVTLSDFTTVRLDRLLLITDVTNNTIIYQFNNSGLGASIAGNVVTLVYNTNTGGFNSGDSLQIVYDSATGDPTYDTPVLPNDAAKETGGNLATLAGTVSGGKLNVNLSSGALPAGSNTIGNVELTDGTNIAGVLAPGTANSSGNAVLAAGTSNTVLFSTTTAQAVAITDAGNYSWVSVQVNSQGASSTVTFQASNDNSTWFNVYLYEADSNGANLVNSVATITHLCHGPIPARYFRLNVTGISGGTTSGYVVFSSTGKVIATQTASALQTGTWNMGSSTATGSAVPSNAFYMGMQSSGGNLTGLSTAQNQGDGASGSTALAVGAHLIYNGTTYDRMREANAVSGTAGTGLLGAGAMGIYNSSAPTAGNGNYYPLQLDSSANLKVTLAAGLSGSSSSVAINDGTNTANVLSPGVNPAGANALMTSGTAYMPSTYTLTTSTTATPWFDMENYTWVSVECAVNNNGTITFETSNDTSQTNFTATTLFNANGGSGSTTYSGSSFSIFHGPRAGRYFRVHATSLSGGNTVTITITLFTAASTPPAYLFSSNNLTPVNGGLNTQVAQLGIYNGSGNVPVLTSLTGDAAGLGGMPGIEPAVYNGSSWDRQRTASSASGTTGTGLLGAGAMGIYNSSAPTASNGDYYQLQLDSAANLKVNLAAGSLSGSSSSIAINDGTNTANVVAGDANGLVTNNNTQTITFSTSSSGVQTLLANTNCKSYASCTIYFTSVGTGLSLSPQFAPNSGGTYVSVSTGQVFNIAGNQFLNTQGYATTGIYTFPIAGDYFQLSVSALTSGTLSGYVVLSTRPGLPSANAVYASGQNVSEAMMLGLNNSGGQMSFMYDLSNLGDAATHNVPGAGNYAYNGTNWDRVREATAASGTTGTGLLGTGAMGIYNTSAPSASNGNYYQLQLDSSANLKVNVAAGSLTASIASDGTIGSAVPTTGIQVAGEDAASNLQSAGVMVSGTANSTGNALLTGSTTFSATWSVTGAGTTTVTDAGNHAWVSVQVSSYTSGTINFQCSNDNSNWFNTTLNQTSVSNGSPTVSGASASIWAGPLTGRYFRLNITGVGATNSGTITFFSTARSSQLIGGNGIQVQTNATTGTAVPANAFYIGVQASSGNLAGVNTPGKAGITGASSNLVSMAIANYVYDGSNFDANVSASTASGTSGTGLLGAGAMGIYNTSAPTAVNGDYYQLQLDSSANLKVNIAAGSLNVASSSATGSAVPANAFYLAGKNSGNLTGLAVDASGNLILTGGTVSSADGITYPVPSAIAAFPEVYNGSTWDRLRSATTASGTTGTGLLGTGALGIYNSSAPTAVSGDYYQLQLDSSANLKVNVAAFSGNVNLSPSASGGWTPYFANAITTTVTVSSAAGKFGGYTLINLNSAPAYLQCFDTTGAVSLGTTTPTFVITLPSNSTAANGLAANIEIANGVVLANGLKVAATTTPTGSSTVSTGISGSIWYH